MQKYQVFARKYRPKNFDEILGQEHVVQTLKNAIKKNRLAHAYLFVGPRGTGKTSTARILAMALNCSGGPKVNYDPQEQICKEIAAGNSLDVFEIDGASNNNVEQVRQLRENVKFRPAKGNFRIYYIDEVHMLTPAAFNALLKTLEEPPAHVKFIFATTEAQKILPTILSRCQRFDLRRIPTEIISAQLQKISKIEGIKLEQNAAEAISQAADGGMRDAQSMLDQLVSFCGNEIHQTDVLEIYGITPKQHIEQIIENILKKNTLSALEIINQLNQRGKSLSILLNEILEYLRQLIIYKNRQQKNEDKKIEELLQLISDEQLIKMLENFIQTSAQIKWSSNKLIYLQTAVIQAIQTLKESSLDKVINVLSKALLNKKEIKNPEIIKSEKIEKNFNKKQKRKKETSIEKTKKQKLTKKEHKTQPKSQTNKIEENIDKKNNLVQKAIELLDGEIIKEKTKKN